MNKVALILTFMGGLLSANADYVVNGDIVLDNDTQLEWQLLHDETELNWEAALIYCNKLQLNGTGWRLPNINEFKTLSKYDSETQWAIDDVFYDAYLEAATLNPYQYHHDSMFWSSTTISGSNLDALTAWPGFGGIVSYREKATLASTRCVRKG